MSLTVTLGTLDLTAAPYMIPHGSNHGGPLITLETVQTLLQDGDIELSRRAGNRTFQFDVIIEGANLAAIATAEAALALECDKDQNTLTVNVGDSAPVTVFRTFRFAPVFNRDDDWENARLRRYTLTFQALPFGTSTVKTTETALPASGSTTTSLDNGSATTGWTGTVNGVSRTPSTAGGSVLLSETIASSGGFTYVLSKTFAATTTSTKYLVVDWKPPVFGWYFTATGSGVNLPLVAEVPSPTAGYVRSYFYVAASSLTALSLQWQAKIEVLVSATYSLAIDSVAVSDVAPVFGTARQQLRSLTVKGSAPSPAQLTVESSTAALGTSLVYVYPNDETTNGYAPPLRQFRSAGLSTGAVTTDSAMVSGAREPMTLSVYEVPLGLLPEGGYLLLARIGHTGSTTTNMQVTAATTVNGVTIASPKNTLLTPTISVSTTYTIFNLGYMHLPSIDLPPNTTGMVQLSINDSVGARLDEAWLFNVDIGSLIQVDCGTGSGSSGGSARRLFVNPPTLSEPNGSVRIGHAADRSDSFYPASGIASWMTPRFEPPQVNVFTVTPNATDTAVSLAYNSSWHFHAGE